MSCKEQILVICGPTASGKSALALALAERFNGEIVSADSMQIYKYMDIGTAKPTQAERELVPHHMIDIVEPGQEYSVSKYSEDAASCVYDIIRRGKLPIVCGGTGLYIDALVRGNDFLGRDAQTHTRDRLSQEYDIYGGEYMLDKLKIVDPESGDKLHPNDKKRIVRALEVFEDFGVTISVHNEQSQKTQDRFDSIYLIMSPQPREFLYKRINDRVDIMMEQGLLNEVKTLYKEGVLRSTALQAIGYKEMLMHISGGLALDVCTDFLKQKSRNYAKRQITWFNRKKEGHQIVFCENTDFDEVLQETTEILSSYGIK